MSKIYLPILAVYILTFYIWISHIFVFTPILIHQI
nr:MAG TPA: periplasmic nitrate reductase [Caudoviricetes sp.]